MIHFDVQLTKMIIAALIGAALELDTFYIGMTLFSQPIIAGGIAGYIFGDIKTGIIIGSIVQLIWVSPPVGAYVPPSSPAIAFIATVLSLKMPGFPTASSGNSMIMFCLAAGTALGYLVGQMDIWNRKLNTKIVRFFEPEILEGKPQGIIGAQAFSVLAKYLRDSIFYAVIFIFGTQVAVKIYASMPVEALDGLGLAYWAMPAVGMAVIFDTFRSRLGGKFHGTVLVLSYLFLMSYKKISPVFFILAVFAVCGFVVYNFVWNKKEAA